MLIGLLLLTVSNAASWLTLQQISHREAIHAIEKCADPRGDIALRRQWERVASLIVRTNLKPTDPQYIPSKYAGKLFADSYNDAIKEAGAPPECLGYRR